MEVVITSHKKIKIFNINGIKEDGEITIIGEITHDVCKETNKKLKQIKNGRTEIFTTNITKNIIGKITILSDDLHDQKILQDLSKIIKSTVLIIMLDNDSQITCPRYTHEIIEDNKHTITYRQ